MVLEVVGTDVDVGGVVVVVPESTVPPGTVVVDPDGSDVEGPGAVVAEPGRVVVVAIGAVAPGGAM